MKFNKIISSAIMGGLVATAIAFADDHGTATAPAADHGTAEVKKEAAPKVVAKKTKKKKKAVAPKTEAAAHTEGHTDAPAKTEEQKPAAH